MSARASVGHQINSPSYFVEEAWRLLPPIECAPQKRGLKTGEHSHRRSTSARDLAPTLESPGLGYGSTTRGGGTEKRDSQGLGARDQRSREDVYRPARPARPILITEAPRSFTITLPLTVTLLVPLVVLGPCPDRNLSAVASRVLQDGLDQGLAVGMYVALKFASRPDADPYPNNTNPNRTHTPTPDPMLKPDPKPNPKLHDCTL